MSYAVLLAGRCNVPAAGVPGHAPLSASTTPPSRIHRLNTLARAEDPVGAQRPRHRLIP